MGLSNSMSRQAVHAACGRTVSNDAMAASEILHRERENLFVSCCLTKSILEERGRADFFAPAL